ncbi:MAG: hypothetical protein IPP77_07310 [Bacteroidetes bacterium]|nr:hypothetical protein [Bacteroidota bacterium]
MNCYGQSGNKRNYKYSYSCTDSSLTNIIAIAAGGITLFLKKNDGTVWACGNNSSGELGNGTTTSQSIPVQVSSLTGISAIAAKGADCFSIPEKDGRHCLGLWK